jgi:hypothetical protein
LKENAYESEIQEEKLGGGANFLEDFFLIEE